MSLTTALGIAKQSLQATSRQTAVVSQNITNVNNPDYTRRNAVVASEAPGARVVIIPVSYTHLTLPTNREV